MITVRSLAAFTASIATCAVVTVTPVPLAAQEITSESVATRIDVAGRQRMLTQRMAKFFCFARSGVDAVANVQKLIQARDLYAVSHRGLAFGDAEMNLFEEAEESVVRVWNDVDLMWGPLDQVYTTALNGELVSEEDFDRAMRLTSEVMRRNNDMVAQLRAAYADQIGDGGLGAAVLIDLYGRQRMLSQKMAKEVCLMARGHNLDQTRPELAATLELFESSLRAFMEGLAVAGVPAPPTPEIAEQLALANEYWVPIRPIAAAVAGGQGASLSELATFNIEIDKFLVEMNKAVGMLAAHQAAAQG
ncbi:MAG: type IV pili methyl-accepting chemotaxis transducer N-terminal domain-containing protein [Pseudomonadota bacterium]